MPSATPAMLVHTGTDEDPTPGSSAMRTPDPTATGTLRRASSRDENDTSERGRSAARTVRALRHAGHSVRTTTTTRMPSTPRSATAASSDSPGSGSAVRASPVGNTGETTNASATARRPPTMPITAARHSESAARWGTVVPSEASVGLSVDWTAVNRASSWPTTSSAVIAVSRASNHSAVAWVWNDRCAFRFSSAATTMSGTSPPPSSSMWSRKASVSRAPCARRTSSESPPSLSPASSARTG